MQLVHIEEASNSTPNVKQLTITTRALANSLQIFDIFSVKSTRNQHFNIFFAIFSLMIEDTFLH